MAIGKEKIEDGDFKGSWLTVEAVHVKHCAVLGASVFFAPVLIRLTLMSQRNIVFSFVDLHGFISDLLVSFTVALFLVFIFRKKPLLAIAALFIWSLFNYGAYEHVMALGALPSISNIGYLADTTFLRASALTVSRPVLFIFAVVLPPAFLWLFFRRRERKLKPALFILPIIALFIINIFWKDNSEALMWRQTNFIDNNVGYLISSGDDDASSGFVVSNLLGRADLNGRPVIELPGSAKNVLLIMLESVSGAYVESVAKYQNISSPITLPYLSELAKNNINFTTFIANQRQTNRGEYALLCGDYPKLASKVAKMSEVVLAGKNVPCLPSLLSSAGYESVYLQSAALPFMLKDQFMERIGFSRVYGKEYFKDAYSRNPWGVDDKAYFEQSVEMVAELERADKPWFLTMLTVGTHDPYNVPKNYESPYKKGSIEEAFSYLDEALADFLATLEAKGFLKDTLVLLTSDESAGITHKTSDFITRLSQNWGLFVAKLPAGEQMERGESFMLVDIPISVLDYLGLSKMPHKLSGRSLFRKYDKKRKIYFANTYLRSVSLFDFLDPQGSLSTCDESFKRCNKYRIDSERPFSLAFESTEFTQGDRAALVAASRESKSMNKDFKGFDLELIPSGSVNITDHISQFIFGGQFMSTPENVAMDVEIDIEVLDSGGRFTLTHSFRSRYFIGDEEWYEVHLEKVSPLMGTGDRYRLKYTYYPGKALRMAESSLFSSDFAGDAIRLRINRAHLKVYPCVDRPCMETGIDIDEMRLNDFSLL